MPGGVGPGRRRLGPRPRRCGQHAGGRPPRRHGGAPARRRAAPVRRSARGASATSTCSSTGGCSSPGPRRSRSWRSPWRRSPGGERPLLVADLGTGSGAIALSLARGAAAHGRADLGDGPVGRRARRGPGQPGRPRSGGGQRADGRGRLVRRAARRSCAGASTWSSPTRRTWPTATRSSRRCGTGNRSARCTPVPTASTPSGSSCGGAGTWLRPGGAAGGGDRCGPGAGGRRAGGGGRLWTRRSCTRTWPDVTGCWSPPGPRVGLLSGRCLASLTAMALLCHCRLVSDRRIIAELSDGASVAGRDPGPLRRRHPLRGLPARRRAPRGGGHHRAGRCRRLERRAVTIGGHAG